MGLILKRFGIAALVVGALYATIFRARPPRNEGDTLDPRFQRLYELSRRQRQAIVLWSAHAIRDSAVRRIATMTVERGEPEIVAMGFPHEAGSPEAAALIRDRWSSLEAPDSSARMVVLIMNETVFDSLRSPVYPYSGAMMARSLAGDACLAMTYGTLNPRGDVDVVGSQLDRALAPCLLRAAFGTPGRGVKEWLDRTRSAAAKSNAWLYRPRDFIDGRGQLPWEPISELSADDVRPGNLADIVQRLALSEVTVMLSPPYLMGGPALRCLAGHETDCTRTVLDSIPVTEALPAELSSSWGFSRETRRNAILSPHPIGDWFLSDIIRWEGRERFARFWKSDASFETAFREAFGRELGSWVRAWGTRQGLGGWEEMFLNKQVVLGASLRPSWPFLVIGWTAIAVLIAAWTARRRQVTA